MVYSSLCGYQSGATWKCGRLWEGTLSLCLSEPLMTWLKGDMVKCCFPSQWVDWLQEDGLEVSCLMSRLFLWEELQRIDKRWKWLWVTEVADLGRKAPLFRPAFLYKEPTEFLFLTSVLLLPPGMEEPSTLSLSTPVYPGVWEGWEATSCFLWLSPEALDFEPQLWFCNEHICFLLQEF